jgi:basic membrane protein A
MDKMTRRRLGVVVFLTSAAVLGGGACRKKVRPVEPEPETTEQAPAESAPGDKGFVVAFLYAGPKEDYGFNKAHSDAAAALGRLPGVTVIEEDNVPENGAATLVIEKLVTMRGAKVVFATGFGHFDPGILAAANKHADVRFFHNGGFYQEGKHPLNAGSYAGFLDEAYYVSGVVAGMTTKTNHLGFIASKPLAHVLRDINAFTLGARSVNTKVTTSVVFTGSWSAPEKEEKLANEMADKKIDVIAAYVNAPRTILETAERRGVYSIGAHSDGRRFAPKGYLTGAECTWAQTYTSYVRAVRAGKPVRPILRGGFSEALVTISPFGPAVSEAAKRKAMAAREALAQGKLVIFKGPLKDNRGKVAISAGQQIIARDVSLELMSYLVEGAFGSLR